MSVPGHPEVAVAVVSYDTRDVLRECLESVRAAGATEVVVVDNGSTDGSAQIAARNGAVVVTEPRRGFGAAVHCGILAARTPIVAVCDADGSFDLAQLERVCRPVQDGTAELVLGRRRPTTWRAWPVHARLGNAVLARRLRRRTGAAVHDLGPMRAARRDGLLALDLQDRRSGYPLEMVLRAAEAGWRIQEVDVDYAPRTGCSKVTGTLRGTASAVADMSRLLRQGAP